LTRPSLQVRARAACRRAAAAACDGARTRPVVPVSGYRDSRHRFRASPAANAGAARADTRLYRSSTAGGHWGTRLKDLAARDASLALHARNSVLSNCTAACTAKLSRSQRNHSDWNSRSRSIGICNHLGKPRSRLLTSPRTRRREAQTFKSVLGQFARAGVGQILRAPRRKRTLQLFLAPPDRVRGRLGGLIFVSDLRERSPDGMK